MNKYSLATLSVTAGILSGLAWTEWCPGQILLFSFTPFVFLEEYMFRNRNRFSQNDFFIFIIPGLLIFNLIALGWTRAAGIIAAITIISGLSAVMAFVIWLAHIIRIRTNKITGIVSVITFWLSFEYLSLHTDYLSPWMNLGNGFAKNIMFVQWYEITGVSGGTLWIIISNLTIGAFLSNVYYSKIRRDYLLIWLIVIIIPVVISLTRFFTIKSTSVESARVILVQPNIDPFNQKYSIPFEDQLNKVIDIAEHQADDQTDWIVTPETLIDDPVNESGILDNKYITKLKNFTVRNPNTNILTGMVTFNNAEYDSVKTDILTSHSKQLSDKREIFNSAVKIDSGSEPEIYHKSKLVAGIEKEFSRTFGSLINKIIPDYYGTGWGYGTQKDREVFQHRSEGHKIAPIICYESVYGDFVAGFVRSGAEALFIITNDGWWKNTIGYKQHLNYASLRAIETRRQVARAANTGISCFIDIRGTRVSETKWWEESTLSGTIYYETCMTPYVKYGDYLMRIASVTTLFIILYVFIALPVRKKITAH